MKTYTSNCSIVFPAESKEAATRLVWKILNTLIDNETIDAATVTYVDQDFDEPLDTPTQFWSGYTNYPGKCV